MKNKNENENINENEGQTVSEDEGKETVSELDQNKNTNENENVNANVSTQNKNNNNSDSVDDLVVLRADVEQLRKENVKLKMANKFGLSLESLAILGDVDDSFEQRAENLAKTIINKTSVSRDPNVGVRSTNNKHNDGNDWLREVFKNQ